MRAHMWVRISSVLLIIAFEGTYVPTYLKYVGTYVGTDAE